MTPPGSKPWNSAAKSTAADTTDGVETSHLLDVDDLTREELLAILDQAAAYKRALERGEPHADLPGRTLGMLYEKPSTRTRVSFETGMTQLGGHAIFLDAKDSHVGHGEPIRDTARTLSRYVDAILARVFDHETVETLAAYADVPVINGLSDAAHPCQTLADLLTIREHCGGFEDVTVAWIGDGNNVAHSFALGCALTGIDLTVASPAGYGIDDAVVERADELVAEPTVTTDPVAAVTDADVVYTDVWVSMGEEDEREEKLAAFEGFQVNRDLLENAPDAAVMHCLPAHRGEEITDDVLESDRTIIFDQAENRLHAQKGLLARLVE